MKITYIYHSCFLVELERCLLLFDYYKGTIPTLDPQKHLYVFASHRHHDHFNKKIFTLNHPHITYILSDDISVKKDAYLIAPHQYLCIDDMQISTLKSTDEGVAFLVEVEDKIMYHAGDLNWWDWGSEDSESECEEMKKAYQSEIDLLRGKIIDLAFVPVDPRLEERFYKGAAYLVNNVNVCHLFPMHMWKEEKKISEALYQHASMNDKQDSFHTITAANEIFLI